MCNDLCVLVNRKVSTHPVAFSNSFSLSYKEMRGQMKASCHIRIHLCKNLSSLEGLVLSFILPISWERDSPISACLLVKMISQMFLDSNVTQNVRELKSNWFARNMGVSLLRGWKVQGVDLNVSHNQPSESRDSSNLMVCFFQVALNLVVLRSSRIPPQGDSSRPHSLQTMGQCNGNRGLVKTTDCCWRRSDFQKGQVYEVRAIVFRSRKWPGPGSPSYSVEKGILKAKCLHKSPPLSTSRTLILWYLFNLPVTHSFDKCVIRTCQM